MWFLRYYEIIVKKENVGVFKGNAVKIFINTYVLVLDID